MVSKRTRLGDCCSPGACSSRQRNAARCFEVTDGEVRAPVIEPRGALQGIELMMVDVLRESDNVIGNRFLADRSNDQ